MRFRAFSMFAMVACLSLIAPSEVVASEVVATITGTVYEGSDTSGKSTPGLFAAPGTDLAGLPFILTFTFDDALGTTTVLGAPPYESQFVSQNPNGTGNVVLEIGGVSYAYPAPDGPNPPEAYRTGGLIASTAYFYSSVQDATNDSNAVALVYPATGTILTPDVNWESSFTDSNLGGLGVYAANINVATPDGYLSASVSLTATSITVTGPMTSTTEPGTCALLGFALATTGLLFRHRRPVQHNQNF